MSCFKPTSAFQSVFKRNPKTGKRIIFWKKPTDVGVEPIQVSCGQCIGCRLERSRQWAVRIHNEAQLHPSSSFLTLTYDDEHVPYGGTLHKPDLQKFFKRLRQRIAPQKVRYFACGEYGDKTDRPHYHVCLFGYHFPDRVLWRERDGFKLYTSELLSEVWPKGFHTIGNLTVDTAAYTARYCMKKINGEKADEHYSRIVESTGELIRIEPEFAVMSLKPAIGKEWFDKYSSDVYPHGAAVFKGREMRSPKYYDALFERIDPEGFEDLKERRAEMAREREWDNTLERREVREEIARARLNLARREL